MRARKFKKKKAIKCSCSCRLRGLKFDNCAICASSWAYPSFPWKIGAFRPCRKHCWVLVLQPALLYYWELLGFSKSCRFPRQFRMRLSWLSWVQAGRLRGEGKVKEGKEVRPQDWSTAVNSKTRACALWSSQPVPALTAYPFSSVLSQCSLRCRSVSVGASVPKSVKRVVIIEFSNKIFAKNPKIWILWL